MVVEKIYNQGKQLKKTLKPENLKPMQKKTKCVMGLSIAFPFICIFRVDVDPDSLRWTPVLSGPASLYGSPYKRDSGPFFVSRSPPPNSSHSKKSSKKEKGRQSSSSESSSEEEEEESATQVSKTKSSKKQVLDKAPKSKKDRKNSESKKSTDDQLLTTRQKTVGGKKVEEKHKKGKKGRKKKSDGESSTSSSDEKKKKVDSISNSSSSEDSSTSDEDDKEEKVEKSRNRKSFGRKVATTTTSTTSVGNRQNASGTSKRPNKHSGEYEGLDGGENSNINSITTTTSRHHTTNDVAKVRDNAASKSRSVIANNDSSEKGPAEKTGILNRAIGRLLELGQTDDPKSRHKSCEREANDADVEDEVEDRVVNGKAKVALNFESPTKKVKKRSPDFASRRFKRAAASKASDRIARESRGSINLDSSTSSDSDDASIKKIDSANKASTSKTSTAIKSTPEVAKVKSKLDIFSRKLQRSVSKIELAVAVPVQKIDNVASVASAKNVRHSDTSDFEDENVTLASKFKKGVGAKSSRKNTDTNLTDSVKKLSAVKKKHDDEVPETVDATKKQPLPLGSGSKDTKDQVQHFLFILNVLDSFLVTECV